MNRATFLLIFLTVVLFLNRGGAASQQSRGPDQRFGITEAFWAPSEASELGLGWERILFYWREIQPTGTDDWNTLHVREEWIAQANSQGRKVVGLIKNTPLWASSDGTEAGVPSGLYLPTDDPGNLWAQYVRKLGEYYGARNVHHWIIWNEPEIKPGVYGFEFSGSISDYYQLVKVAYQVMKASDPQAVIHLAGLTWWHDPTYLGRFLDVASEDPDGPSNDFFFDVVSLHIYFRSETVESIVKQVRATLEEAGLDKQIWINETNASPNLDVEWPVNRPVFQVDVDQQAWFIIHALSLGFASGAESVGVYKMVDIRLPAGAESFGILRPDFSRRPAFNALRTSSELLSGFVDVTMQKEDEFYVITFVHEHKAVRVLWSRYQNALAIALPVVNEVSNVVDPDGSSSLLVSTGGYHLIKLEGARCEATECIVGGPPVFIVEQSYSMLANDVEPAVYAAELPLEAVLTATPTATPTNTATPSPTSSPLPSPTATSTPSPTSTATATVWPTKKTPAQLELTRELALLDQKQGASLDESRTKSDNLQSGSNRDGREILVVSLIGASMTVAVSGFLLRRALRKRR